MEYNSFLSKIIDAGIEAAKRDYSKRIMHLKGAVEGFEACRDKNPDELLQLLRDATGRYQDAYNTQSEKFWYYSTFRSEVEWVCGCVSTYLFLNGEPPIASMTLRTAHQAIKVLKNHLEA